MQLQILLNDRTDQSDILITSTSSSTAAVKPMITHVFIAVVFGWGLELGVFYSIDRVNTASIIIGTASYGHITLICI